MSLLFLALACLQEAQGPPEPDISAIEQQALDYRRAIKSGHVELNSQYWTLQSGKRVTKTTVRTIWFDAEQRREDDKRRYSEDEDPPRFYREISCFSKQGHIFWSDQELPDQGKYAVRVDRRKKNPDTKKAYPVIDPRMLGMLPETCANLVKYNLDTYVGRPDRKGISAKRAFFKSTECWLICYTTLREVSVRYWVAPSFGYNLLRVESEFTHDGDHYVNSTETDYGQFGKSAWFPTKCVYERKVNDKPVTQEVLQVKAFALNSPIDSKIFTLEGIDIPPNTYLFTLPSDPRGELKWNGEEIAAVSEKVIFPGVRPASASKRVFRLAALGLAGVAAVAFFWYVRKKRLAAAALNRPQ